jgi:hypothetical protein
MNKPTLANLYRQATRDANGATLPDAETLVALANGERPADAERVVAEVAQSALQSDLLHFTRALEPASAALSAELAATFGERQVPLTHGRAHAVPGRMAAGRWRQARRFSIGLAAAIVAAVALWSQQYKTASVITPPAVASKGVPDRIFAAMNERTLAVRSQPDKIFRGDFRDDVIFRSNGG